jgi:PAS domain S-box-containing protein
MEKALSLMRNLELFRILPDCDLAELAACSRVGVFDSGATILDQGVPPGDFYILCEGDAEVVLDNKVKEKVTLTHLGPGEYFGEMSILTGEPTSAAIIASGRCTVLAVSKDGFDRMLELLPGLCHKLVRTLSLRLKKGNLGAWEARNKEIALTLLMEEEKSILNLIMHALPDGMIVFDENLTILEINANAKQIFGCTREVIGQTLDVLLDTTEFKRVFAEKRRLELECGYLENQKIIRQIVFPLENKAVGIFTDITNELKQQEELSRIKEQTINRANEVIKKQLRVVQLIAGLLGETTAETKAELGQLIKFLQDDERKG